MDCTLNIIPCCDYLGFRECVRPSMNSPSGTILSCGLQMATYTSLRAHQDHENFPWLGLQESIVGIWTFGDLSLTFSPQWRHLPGSKQIPARLVASFPSPCMPQRFPVTSLLNSTVLS